MSTFAVSILLIVGLNPPPPEYGDRSGTGYWTTLRTGLTQVVRDPGVRTVCLGLFLTVVFGSLATAALVFLATDALHGPTWLYGALTGCFGTGTVAAGLSPWAATATTTVPFAASALAYGVAPILRRPSQKRLRKNEDRGVNECS